jgi:hypothetical protein
MHQVTTGEILAASIEVGFHTSFKFDEEMYRRISCPVLVVHGRLDTIIRVEAAEKIAELTGAELEIWEDAAHAPNGRHPARFNLLMEDFLQRHFGRTKVISKEPLQNKSVKPQTKAPKKVLYLSSRLCCTNQHYLGFTV